MILFVLIYSVASVAVTNYWNCLDDPAMDFFQATSVDVNTVNPAVGSYLTVTMGGNLVNMSHPKWSPTINLMLEAKVWLKGTVGQTPALHKIWPFCALIGGSAQCDVKGAKTGTVQELVPDYILDGRWYNITVAVSHGTTLFSCTEFLIKIADKETPTTSLGFQSSWMLLVVFLVCFSLY